MKLTTHVKWGELKIGLLLIFAFSVLMWASLSGGGTSIFDSKVTYRGYFQNINGLVTGAPVWIAGVEVGNVSSIKFVNLDSVRQLELKIRVVKSARNMITTDAKIKLGTIGFLGDKYVEIIPGDLSKPQLEKNSILQTAPTGDINATLAEGEKVMVATGGLMENLTDITDRIKRGEGSAGKLVTDEQLYTEMTRLIASMTILVDGLQKNQERITSAMENVSDDLAGITAKVDNNTGTLGKLVGQPELYDNLHSSTGRIDSILGKINDGYGTAGAIVNDDELYQEVKNLVVRIENLVADIEANPRKYFKFSVF